MTPAPGDDAGEPEEWFAQVVDTEIAPLLHEYWFDDPGESRCRQIGIAEWLGVVTPIPPTGLPLT